MKKFFVIGAIIGLALVAGWAFFRKKSDLPDIEYRYAKIEKGELIRSISATGRLVALTSVDVKSKAGGKVIQLAVDEGSVVKKGDLVAVIDPADTEAIYKQAEADVQSAEARAEQARVNLELQQKNTATAVKDAEVAVELAKIRLQRAESDAKNQPSLTQADISSSRAAVTTAEQQLDALKTVTIPLEKQQADSGVTRAKTDLETAKAEYERQRDLHAKGYVALAAVERARSSLASAQAAYDNAVENARTLNAKHQSDLKTATARLEQAKAQLQQAQTNSSRDFISQKALEEAKKNLTQAQLSLDRAKADRMNVELRDADRRSAEAGTVRSKVSMENAKVQLDSTTVVAPRDGVVTLKYLEEGTIIPPGTSTFAQGTSLVQISDTTQMFVECQVDEADISQVKANQKVRIIIEAFPGQNVDGVVERVNPAARTESNITSIKVRIKVLPGSKVQLLPGMTATCEFLTLQKKDVLVAPSQAIKREGEATFVMMKSSDEKKPTKRIVKTGDSGNDGVEILEGLKEGEEVVVAEINLDQLRETQEKMLQQQQGGGLAGGGPSGFGRSSAGGGARPGGAGAGGGGRPGGGGGR